MRYLALVLALGFLLGSTAIPLAAAPKVHSPNTHTVKPKRSKVKVKARKAPKLQHKSLPH